MRALPLGPMSFLFMQFPVKRLQNEILDPPVASVDFIVKGGQKNEIYAAVLGGHLFYD